jgi:hypothetical protein
LWTRDCLGFINSLLARTFLGARGMAARTQPCYVLGIYCIRGIRRQHGLIQWHLVIISAANPGRRTRAHLRPTRAWISIVGTSLGQPRTLRHRAIPLMSSITSSESLAAPRSRAAPTGPDCFIVCHDVARSLDFSGLCKPA